MKPHGINTSHPDLLDAQHLAYEPLGLLLSTLKPSAESREYAACEFELNCQRITFRVAKITPTKIGQFATLWKRIGKGPIMPYDMADPIDFFIISVRNTTSLGQFIFPMNVLHKHGFISKDGIGGKRAMRLYAPWDITDNHQAKKTQSWQLKYFLEITPKFAIATARTLLGIWRNEGNLDK